MVDIGKEINDIVGHVVEGEHCWGNYDTHLVVPRMLGWVGWVVCDVITDIFGNVYGDLCCAKLVYIKGGPKHEWQRM